ncbi:MAG: hypothetical protein H6709_24050 [Kofleriaceae bacterium]|nr:hypothetical protein [Myxococcales bacterium]MCB9559980.1 hypothetical protein [Kofleriaceae bacterium]MCB9575161.1 hypothetical protein [Kofleriaceae bacterium]
MRVLPAALLACVAVVAAPRVAAAGDGTDLLGLLPDDAALVGVLDAADARGAALADRAIDALVGRSPGVAAALASVDFDPKADLDTLLIATDRAGGDPAWVVVVVEGRVPARALAGLAKVDEDGDGKPDWRRKKRAGVAYYEGPTVALALVDQRLLVATTSAMPALIDHARKKQRRTSLATSTAGAAMRAAIAGTDTRHDLWLAAEVPATMARQAGAFAPQWLSLGVTFGADLVVQVRARFGDADTAASLVALAAAQLDQVRQSMRSAGLAGAADSLTIEAEKELVEARVTLSEAEATTLTGLIGAL